MLPNFDNTASVIPLVGMGTHLVLYSNGVTDDQGWELTGVFRQPLGCKHVPVAQGVLPFIKHVLPSRVGMISAREDRNEIPYWVAEHAHGR
jgi:hypothetical protein